MAKQPNAKKSENPLDTVRHSAAHLLAAAVLDLYPGANNAIGPAIENGFYQDFDLHGQKISEEDLPKIEAKMREILKDWKTFETREVDLEEAKKLFASNPYKIALAEEFAAEGKALTVNDPGNFLDLCKGGHSENPQEELKNFKLLNIAGAYWKGDEKNQMLTRIYGTVWPSKKELEDYLVLLEESKNRDHRKIGKDLGLWTFSDLVGAGLPLFTPKGTIIRTELFQAVAQISRKYGVQQVTIPHIAKKKLYEISGHADKFSEELLRVISHYDEFVMKPVNCPHHTQIYASELRSYRDLPIRYMESTMQYRDEKPGEIGGLTRVRSITCEDGHTFCTVDQIKKEVSNTAEIIKEFYAGLGMWGNHWVSLSVRDPNHPEKYVGEPADWKRAEEMLQEISDDLGLDAKNCEGEAAIYGPKLDYMFVDSLGRERQLATIQLDFAMPKRFGLTYIDKSGKEQIPVMIHRAILGSYERFMAILLEHFAGALPTWLSPVQVTILPITDAQNDYAEGILKELRNAGIRAEVNLNSEKIGAKIRDAQLQKIPYMLIVGQKEIEEKSASVRLRSGEDLHSMAVPDIISRIQKEIQERA